jgi:hypothetical protein
MFRTAASSVIGLLVEDGRLALGAVAALVITWLAAGALGDAAGWLLLALILVLVVANVLAVGVRLRRPA